jgi:hypothetical protein
MASLALCDLQGGDRRFVASLIDLLVQPEHARTAASFRAGNYGLRYRVPDGALIGVSISMDPPRSCRKCGCTDFAACYDKRTGYACYWIEDRLCSACAPLPKLNATGKRILRALGRGGKSKR